MLNEAHFQALIARQRAFALFRLPNNSQVQFVAQTQSAPVELTGHYRALNPQRGFVIAPFSRTSDTPCVVIQPDVTAQGSESISAAIARLVNTDLTAHPAASCQKTSPQTAPDYDAIFAQFHDALSRHAFEKLVLSHPLSLAKSADFSLTDTFSRACQAYPAAFVYLCFTPQTGTWLGASPEILVEGEGENWRTVSLAGTQIATNNPVWDDKNRQEQRLVTQYIQNTLAALALPCQVSATYTTQTGNLMHLKSDIAFTLSPPLGIGDVIEQLHPTPAVCGLPKQTAYDFILAHEGYMRAYYTGFVGYLSPSEPSHLFVNLRCMQIDVEHVTLYAGGGLLASSICVTEWQEIQAKLQAMRSILNEDLAV